MSEPPTDDPRKYDTEIRRMMAIYERNKALHQATFVLAVIIAVVGSIPAIILSLR